MKKDKKRSGEAITDKILIAEASIRKIMSYLGADDALVSAAMALGKFIREHGVDFYDKLEMCNRVHSGTQLSAGIMALDMEE